MQMVSSLMGVVRRFGVANVSWSRGTIEQISREVVKTPRAVLIERCGLTSE